MIMRNDNEKNGINRGNGGCNIISFNLTFTRGKWRRLFSKELQVSFNSVAYNDASLGFNFIRGIFLSCDTMLLIIYRRHRALIYLVFHLAHF